MAKEFSVDALISDFNKQDRRALAKVITYIESEQDEHQKIIEAILFGLKKPKGDAMVVAVSGPPGVGKSTFINALGKIIENKKFRVAVLAIDPSSEISGGSILADKTRMTHLMKSPDVFIRPSPSRGTLGGISLRSHDVIFALKSFGFDFIVLETVGVGQSETLAKALADHFVVLMQPGAGDELQGMKKGLLEITDFILVNKADGELEKLALQSKIFLQSTQSKAKNEPVVDMVSAQTGRGIEEFLRQILERHERMLKDGSLEFKRSQGLAKIVRVSFEQALLRHIRQNLRVGQKLDGLATQVVKERSAIAPKLHELIQEITTGMFKDMS